MSQLTTDVGDICHAIQPPEVGEDAVEWPKSLHGPQVFDWQDIEVHCRLGGFAELTFSGDCDHVLRDVTRVHLHSQPREEERVFSSPAVQLKDVAARRKRAGGDFPDSITLRAADRRVGEYPVILLRNCVEGSGRGSDW